MRRILSDVGERTLTIFDTVDNFAIKPGGMPNGDSSLEVVDPTSGVWYAHDRATPPLIPYVQNGVDDDNDEWTINFWLKCSIANGSMNSYIFWRIGDWESTSTTGNDQQVCFTGLADNSRPGQVINRFTGTDIMSATNDGWQMFSLTMNLGTFKTYRNGVQLSTETAGAGGLVDIINRLEFSIGCNLISYTDARSPKVDPGGHTEFGKFSFWNSRVLDASELLSLYNAMFA